MFLYCFVEFRVVFLYLFLGVDCLTHVSVCFSFVLFACVCLFFLVLVLCTALGIFLVRCY